VDARPSSYVCGGREAHPHTIYYVHVLEPTTSHGPGEEGDTDGEIQSDRLLRDIWGEGPYIANLELERESAIEVVEKEDGLISYARHFFSNVSK
jgi:hypothetical protein